MLLRVFCPGRPLLLLLLAPLLLLLLLTRPAAAQQAGDTTSVACPPPRVPRLCVELDASRAVDPAAGPLLFRWDMGDGTQLTGATVAHCYAERRRYTVRLDVVDEASGEVREAEKLLDVDFTKQTVVNFRAADTVRVGQPVAFDAADSQLPACQNMVVIWDFRDGATGTGPKTEHRFRRPGRYAVRMALRANGPGACPDSHCVSRTVVVLP
ncbi:PKD domain-containing protein [Hymenobacter actinosclerus]|uniref:PKD domain-containing protein n=1 Tax=Hymenobacter actinosclerus TaxID=82805 RepID=A0A1I0H6W4_9BACT|nr:PKD domain-containing protein [Hymenobacter actinosclerus]SET78581.1 PKD domain-containing protein [Hymenobacter actinosclerus]